jgi:diaminopimelate decarboxylase
MAAEDMPPMGLAASLLAEHFSAKDGVLHIGGVPVTMIASVAGTPCYIYDAELMRRTYRALATSMAGFAEVYFSIKANPNPHIARLFVSEGAGLEIASAAEYDRARAAGCLPGNILFAGPGKRDAELEYVLRSGIGEIHVESEIEIAKLSAIAMRLGCKATVAIRVNPSSLGQGGAMLMGGRPAPFGIDEERLLEAADLVETSPGLELSGVHLFAGTQILDSEVLARQWAHCIDIAARLATHLGRPLATIDLGGGLGIPYFTRDRALDLAMLRPIAERLAQRIATNPLLKTTRVILEPGRFLAGPAGIYLAGVTDVKYSRGERFIITDGGLHHHLAASGNLGQVIKRDYPLVAADRLDDPDLLKGIVVGPLCTPLDTIGRDTPLPALRPGNLVAVLQSGAYGLTASPVGFLSQPMPAEVLVDKGELRIVRQRGSFEQPITLLPLA